MNTDYALHDVVFLLSRSMQRALHGFLEPLGLNSNSMKHFPASVSSLTNNMEPNIPKVLGNTAVN
jgi:hypothetical protein